MDHANKNRNSIGGGVRVLCAGIAIAAPLPAFAAEAESPERVETVVVYGTDMNKYVFDRSEAATGFDADTDELPRSVQVIPEQVILDQNAETLTDALRNAAGVTRAHGFGGAEDQFLIRGIANNHLFVDGNPVGARHRVDVSNIAQVEVVKGPASILHGQVSPGGIINVVTKKPRAQAATSVQFDMDEHGGRELTLDSTGRLGSDSLLYRTVVAAEDSETFREVNTADGTEATSVERLSISPSVTWMPTERDQVTFRVSFNDQELPIDRGTVALAGENGELGMADIPRQRRLGSEFDIRDSRDLLVQVDYDHDFDNGWSNRFKVGAFEKKFDDYQTRPAAGLDSSLNFNLGAVTANGMLVRTHDGNLDVTEKDLFISDSLSGTFGIGGVDNSLYVGANYYRRGVDHTDAFALTGAGVPGVYTFDVDIVDIRADEQPPLAAPKSQTAVSRNDEVTHEAGLSVQNLAQLTERLNLLAGLRYDYFEREVEQTAYYTALSPVTFMENAMPEKSEESDHNDNLSGQLGLLYEMVPGVSTYGAYSESFQPNYTDITAGVTSPENLDPEKARQVEFGVKSQFLDDRARLSLAWYDLERRNVAKAENLQLRLNGEEESRGVELEGSLQLVDGMNLIFSYARVDAEIVDDGEEARDNEGNTPFGVPEDSARVWGTYEFTAGSLRGLGLGAGAVYTGSRQGDDANNWTLPSYTVFDFAGWYYLPVSADSQIKLQAGVKNLTDEEYYPANLSAFRINVGEPRTVYASVRYEL
ncbi:TonB-dependent siderophore receptor [Microbulbifer halophilus]|uniref:TonB-dependent siderophore receptor n=1 Tax=Microbulbifer halophilus TaxID=453963 RepID=A0ABW5E7Z7_9GAMM|nr:TonB-dependent receptor [Microbulbifer halophilus]MCW8127254.1 TonB-dependent receptor [Microbulbifer halophilus]